MKTPGERRLCYLQLFVALCFVGLLAGALWKELG